MPGYGVQRTTAYTSLHADCVSNVKTHTHTHTHAQYQQHSNDSRKKSLAMTQIHTLERMGARCRFEFYLFAPITANTELGFHVEEYPFFRYVNLLHATAIRSDLTHKIAGDM